jgi:hypothetical protein
MNRKKHCAKCDAEITKSNWSNHLKSRKHLENDPDQTIKPGRHRTSNMPTKRCAACILKLQLAIGPNISRAENILQMTQTKPLNQEGIEHLIRLQNDALRAMLKLHAATGLSISRAKLI